MIAVVLMKDYLSAKRFATEFAQIHKQNVKRHRTTPYPLVEIKGWYTYHFLTPNLLDCGVRGMKVDVVFNLSNKEVILTDGRLRLKDEEAPTSTGANRLSRTAKT